MAERCVCVLPVPLFAMIFCIAESVVIEQHWEKGGKTDCSFDTTLQTSVVVNSSIQCLALMQPHSGKNRIASFNKLTGECSTAAGQLGSAVVNTFVTLGSAMNKENGSCEEIWEKVLEVDPNGSVLFGDLAMLISSIKDGSYIRIHREPNFYMEAEDVIFKRGTVCGSATFVLSKTNWDTFESDMHWQFTKICTSGKIYVSKTYIGVISNLPNEEYSSASSWFVRKHKKSFPNPVYCNSKTNPSTCGELTDLIIAAKQGFEIRCNKIDESDVISSHNPSRIETQLGGSNCRVFGQMFWKVGSYIETFNRFQFFKPLYWWIRLFSTVGEYDATRWFIGDYELLLQTTSAAAMDWFIDYCWKVAYVHNAAGYYTFGSLQSLIDLLLLAKRVRVVFDSYSIEADTILTKEGMVTAHMVSQIDTESPATFPSNKAHLKLVQLSTNGKSLVDLFKIGSSDRVGQETSFMAASWILETRNWNLVLRTDENGVAVKGSKHDIEQAIQTGSRLRCVVHIDALTRLIITMDNIDIDNDGNVAAQFFRWIEFGDGTDPAFSPYWRIIILTTNGKMKETRWTLGEHENRGNKVTFVTVGWFVD